MSTQRSPRWILTLCRSLCGVGDGVSPESSWHQPYDGFCEALHDLNLLSLALMML